MKKLVSSFSVLAISLVVGASVSYAEDACDSASVIDPAIEEAANANSCNADGNYVSASDLVDSVLAEKNCRGAKGREERILNGLRLLRSAGVNVLNDSNDLRSLKKSMDDAIKAACRNGDPKPKPSPEPSPTPAQGAPLSVQQLIELINKNCRSNDHLSCICAGDKAGYVRDNNLASQEVINDAMNALGCPIR